MFMTTAKHRRLMFANNQGAKAAYLEERERSRKVGRALSEKIAECEALRAELQPFLDRREKAKANLRQFQPKRENA